jgi:hypothetical protein
MTDITEDQMVTYTLSTEPMPYALTAGGDTSAKAARILAAHLVHDVSEHPPLTSQTLSYILALSKLIDTGELDDGTPKLRVAK